MVKKLDLIIPCPPQEGCCCPIPEDAPCSIKDAVVIRLRELLGIGSRRIGTDLAETSTPRAVVTDLGESGESGTSEFRQGERRIRIRYYDCNQSNVVNAQTIFVRQLRKRLASKEGMACVHTTLRDGITKNEGIWSSQTTLRMTVSEVF